MKRLVNLWSVALGLALGLGLFFAPSQAQAQFQVDEVPELARDWTVRAGIFVFNSSAARGAAGEATFSGHVERIVYRGVNYDASIGMGYNGFDRIYNVPLMINLIGRSNNLRYGAGAGYSFGKRLDGRGMSGTALNIILGYQFTRGKMPITADLRYYFISGANNELDGYSFTLGLGF